MATSHVPFAFRMPAARWPEGGRLAGRREKARSEEQEPGPVTVRGVAYTALLNRLSCAWGARDFVRQNPRRARALLRGGFKRALTLG